MYLQSFKDALEKKFSGSLFSVSHAQHFHNRAKEYLYRLSKTGQVEHVSWSWYYFPKKYRDPWDFLSKDKGFKVVIKQTAASIWNYDFVHREVYRLAVEDKSYKKALERFAEKMAWTFEVEYYDKIPYEYIRVDELFVESPEFCVINCMADWSFMDAFAILYFRKDEIDLDKLKRLGRWRRISKSDVRVWTAIKYGCDLFNKNLGKRLFNVRSTNLEQEDIKELVDDAVNKVVEFA